MHFHSVAFFHFFCSKLVNLAFHKRRIQMKNVSVEFLVESSNHYGLPPNSFLKEKFTWTSFCVAKVT